MAFTVKECILKHCYKFETAGFCDKLKHGLCLIGAYGRGAFEREDEKSMRNRIADAMNFVIGTDKVFNSTLLFYSLSNSFFR
jgi:hypothetical protein